LKKPPAVDIQVVGKPDALEALLKRASKKLSAGKSLDELSSLSGAGLLFGITARLRISDVEGVAPNTYFLRLLVESALEDCHKSKGSVSLSEFRKVLRLLLVLRREATLPHTFLVPTQMARMSRSWASGLSTRLWFRSVNDVRNQSLTYELPISTSSASAGSKRSDW